MDLFFLILEYVKAIIWPLTVFVIAFIFRFDIKELIKRIRNIKTPWGDFDLPNQNVPSPNENIPKEIKEEIKKTVSEKEKESKELNLTITKEESAKQIAILQVVLFFEKVYNAIYGSQIATLENLMKNNVGGLWHVALSSWYENFRQNDPILRGYNFNDYIGYLINTGLIRSIEVEGGRKYIITDLGVDFLHYIEKLNYLKFKPH